MSEEDICAIQSVTTETRRVPTGEYDDDRQPVMHTVISTKIQLVPKLQALELLGKYLKMAIYQQLS